MSEGLLFLSCNHWRCLNHPNKEVRLLVAAPPACESILSYNRLCPGELACVWIWMFFEQVRLTAWHSKYVCVCARLVCAFVCLLYAVSYAWVSGCGVILGGSLTKLSSFLSFSCPCHHFLLLTYKQQHASSLSTTALFGINWLKGRFRRNQREEVIHTEEEVLELRHQRNNIEVINQLYGNATLLGLLVVFSFFLRIWRNNLFPLKYAEIVSQVTQSS